jgi:hypothetical protein
MAFQDRTGQESIGYERKVRIQQNKIEQDKTEHGRK